MSKTFLKHVNYYTGCFMKNQKEISIVILLPPAFSGVECEIILISVKLQFYQNEKLTLYLNKK